MPTSHTHEHAPEGEKTAVMHVYDVVKDNSGKLFDDDTHRCIEQSRQGGSDLVANKIHELRVYAEANIPKPVMKAYKAVLREARHAAHLPPPGGRTRGGENELRRRDVQGR